MLLNYLNVEFNVETQVKSERLARNANRGESIREMEKNGAACSWPLIGD